MRWIIVLLSLLVAVSVQGREIAGVDVPETITQDDGTELLLNGAGIRKKLFIKVYIGELYLVNKQSEVATLLGDDSPRRLVMHFLYDEVGKDKLVDGWNDGFKGNGSEDQLAGLSGQIESFNALFETVKKGDQIILDYIPGAGTSVVIRGEEKGVIPGKEFNDLLLSIWLGKKPVTKDLRDDLLGL